MPLEPFEALVYSRRHEEAGRALIANLRRLKTGGGFVGHPMTDASRTPLCTRFAAAVTALLADPAFELSQEGFDRLAVEHATLHAVFATSAFGNADHLLRQFGTVDARDGASLHVERPQHIVKLLLAYSLDSGLELDFEAVFRIAPRLALPAFLGMLTHIVVLSPRAHARREKLLTLGPLFESVDLQESMLPAVSDAYMYCSYATAAGRHEIKRSFNATLRRLIESRVRLPALPARRMLRERPTMLVPIEWFTSLHAMYRCYAASIRQLRSRFRLVMIGRSSEMDAAAMALFDDVVVIPGGSVSLADVVERIRGVAPDIVFYPSVGMAAWWVALASVRLAPVQVAAMGHPASTQSPAIDYVLVDGLWAGDPAGFSETVVVQRPGSTPFIMRPDAEFPEPRLREHPERLRIAVPAMACKLNAPFLRACQSIAQGAGRPVEFHFFPNMVGLTHAHVAGEIRRWIPQAVVHPREDYNAYLRKLAQCDVHLSTFPFGGTNSNIDSMRLAIPMLTLEGAEVHGQTDAGMMRRAGLPEWLITDHPAAYERAALRLVRNDAERTRIARQLARDGVAERFLRVAEGVPESEFPDALWFVYRHHEAIQACGRRWWPVHEREAFVARERAAAA